MEWTDWRLLLTGMIVSVISMGIGHYWGYQEAVSQTNRHKGEQK